MVLPNMLFGKETQFWVCKLSSNHAISNQFGIIVFQQLSPSAGIVSFFDLLFLSSLFQMDIFKLTVYIFWKTIKVSWLKQHSAPTAGISFSPSNDKVFLFFFIFNACFRFIYVVRLFYHAVNVLPFLWLI